MKNKLINVIKINENSFIGEDLFFKNEYFFSCFATPDTILMKINIDIIKKYFGSGYYKENIY